MKFSLKDYMNFLTKIPKGHFFSKDKFFLIKRKTVFISDHLLATSMKFGFYGSASSPKNMVFFQTHSPQNRNCRKLEYNG